MKIFIVIINIIMFASCASSGIKTVFDKSEIMYQYPSGQLEKRYQITTKEEIIITRYIDKTDYDALIVGSVIHK